MLCVQLINQQYAPWISDTCISVLINKQVITMEQHRSEMVPPETNIYKNTRKQPVLLHIKKESITRMWANAQRDGRPAEHRWRPLFNAAKFG